MQQGQDVGDFTQTKEQVARALVAIGAISPLILNENGPDYVLNEIGKRFGAIDRSSTNNPWRIVGERLTLLLEESDFRSQIALKNAVNIELSKVGTECIPSDSAISRMLSGGQKVDLIQGIAFSKVFRCPVEHLSPWEFFGRNSEILRR